MNLRSVLPIVDVKEIVERAVLFRDMYLHYLAETSAKEAHWSGKQSDPCSVHVVCGYSCLERAMVGCRKTNLCKTPP